MSNDEKIFLRQLKMTALLVVFPLVIASGWSIIGDHFENKELRITATKNAEAIESIRKYFLKTEDFYSFFDAHKELANAIRENDVERIQRLEAEIKELRKDVKNVRGGNLTKK